LDFTNPTITVNGVTEGSFYNSNRTISFTASDTNLAAGQPTATLDGAPFTSGSVVSAEAAHTLVVTASDRAGNSTTNTVHFTIDKTLPVISVSGVNEGDALDTFTITFSATDANLATGQPTATLDA